MSGPIWPTPFEPTTDDERDELRRLVALAEMPELFAEIASMTGPELHRQAALRKRYPDDLVRDALTLFELRQRGREKFNDANHLWLTRQGFEQATADAVAIHKAHRFSGRVWDVCCGIGGDGTALAQRCDVVAVDRSPLACTRTLWNGIVRGVTERLSVRCGDALDAGDSSALLHFDPDRRAAPGKRAARIEDYVPAFEHWAELGGRFRGGMIKIGPASNFGGKFPDAEIELISLNGECKEAAVWFGELKGEEPFRATALPTGETIAGHPLAVLAEQSTVGEYVYDPDPAVVRAGLVDLLADRLGLARLDPADEYLTGNQLVRSAFVTPFRVIEETANQDRAWRAAVRGAQWGQVEVKCRHLKVDAASIRRQLDLKGSGSGVLLFARVQGRARCVLAERVSDMSGVN